MIVKVESEFGNKYFSHSFIHHSKNCGVKITPLVLIIEDHTMHFAPVLNLRC